jgi:hypothetical protein
LWIITAVNPGGRAKNNIVQAMNITNKKYTKAGLLGAVWAVAGFALILLDAINRLAGIALQSIESGLTPLQWAVLAVVIIQIAYSEGYRGFQKIF